MRATVLAGHPPLPGRRTEASQAGPPPRDPKPPSSEIKKPKGNVSKLLKLSQGLAIPCGQEAATAFGY